eukprot:677751-Prorocentrum_minimum.AAC.1
MLDGGGRRRPPLGSTRTAPCCWGKGRGGWGSRPPGSAPSARGSRAAAAPPRRRALAQRRGSRPAASPRSAPPGGVDEALVQ